jgi:glycosyltransferase involved in cell wall biosynthesis
MSKLDEVSIHDAEGQMKRRSKNGKNGRSPRVDKASRISLCMIVKNEEHCLRRCLDSVRDYVDEMIIVDTGSTDHTVEIAKSYHAQIYHHPWENDFSKHRNQSLSYATGDWILQLDADEELFLMMVPD